MIKNKLLTSLIVSSLLMSSSPVFANTSTLSSYSTATVAKTTAFTFSLQIGKKHDVITKVEGMNEKRQVVDYTLLPWHLFYQVDNLLTPMVNKPKKEVAYYTSNKSQVFTLHVVEKSTVAKVVSDMKKKYSAMGYKNGSVVPLLNYRYKGTTVNYTNKHKRLYLGFTVFQVKNNVVVIEDKYSFDAGDGMGNIMSRLVQSLR